MDGDALELCDANSWNAVYVDLGFNIFDADKLWECGVCEYIIRVKWVSRWDREFALGRRS